MFAPSSTSGQPATLWLLALMMTAASSQSYQQPGGVAPLSPASSSNSSTNPYWRRPGCYRVGHTRTISIPGCVKFDLSTNACRGFCMSYSIPASADPANGHGQSLHEANFQESELGGGGEPTSTVMMMGSQSVSGEENLQSVSGDQAPVGQRRRLNQLIRSHQQQPQQDGGERRDVVSVSQCCNMMETEDVVINLRCGANEIRRLVFKSAKTCECFFCKHV